MLNQAKNKNKLLMYLTFISVSFILVFLISGCEEEKETKILEKEDLRIGFQAPTIGHAPAHIIYQTKVLENLNLNKKLR